MRVFELADELAVRSIDVMDACADVGLADAQAGTELSDEQVKRVRFAFNQRGAAEVMAQAAAVERSSAPVLAPIADPYPAPGAPPVQPGPGSWPTPQPISKGMHPLIKKSILHFVLAQVVPCIGLYFFVSSVILAGKGRRQVAWSGGRYTGDTAGLVIQILFWAELALMVVVFCVAFASAASTSPQ